MTERALIRRNGPVLGIVNNNPGARNALGLDFYQGFMAGLEQASADLSVAAVMLSGAEGFFCAGGDLNVLIRRREMSVEARLEAIGALHRMIRAIGDCPKPVIAAVEGGAAGAGASLALACDLVVAAEDAYFALSYLKVGLTPDGGVTAFLSEFAPRQLVNEIVMFGDRIPVTRLHQLGAINRLTAKGGAEAEAQSMGERLNQIGPAALASAKRLVNSARVNTLAAQLDAEAAAMAEAQGNRESGEGIAAFLEKRKADFSRFRG